MPSPPIITSTASSPRHHHHHIITATLSSPRHHQAGVSCDQGETFSLNVIPNEAKAGFDIRIPPSTSFEEIRALLDDWTKDEGLSWDFAHWTQPLHEHHVTSMDENKNPCVPSFLPSPSVLPSFVFLPPFLYFPWCVTSSFLPSFLP
jgi:hypothetical protein